VRNGGSLLMSREYIAQTNAPAAAQR
jgi:hypothetical protein